MHSFAKLQSTPFYVLFLCLCDELTQTESIRSFVLTQSHLTIITPNHWIQIDVTRNLVLNGKNQLIEAVQPSVLFHSIENHIPNTNWTPYRHCIG